MPGLTSARTLIERSRSNLDLKGFVFPNDIDKVPHKIVMRFVKRNATQGGRSDLTPEEINRTNDYIVLPVPTQIVDGVSIKYNTTDLGITGEIIAGAASEISRRAGQLDFNNGIPGFAGSAAAAAEGVTRGGISAIGQYAGAAGQAMGAFYGASLLNRTLSTAGVNNPQAVAALSVGLNKTLNPFTTAVFQGVNLRTFAFSWTLSPKTQRESRTLEHIIQKLRSNSLPRVPRNTAGLFMEFPDTVEFNLIGMIQDTFTFPTSPCVVEALKFDRTPTGSPVFFAGTGAPAIVQITMKLVEIRPLVRDEFDNQYEVNTNSLLSPSNIAR